MGALLYLSTRTRPDISFAVSNVAKYCNKPLAKHWTAVKRIFRYLRGTSEYGIVYESNGDRKLVGYSDASWAGDQTDRKSVSGYCFFIGNSIVSWRSSRQTCVALSTAEAEFVALAGAAEEAVWIGKFFTELGFAVDYPILLNEDNQAAIRLAEYSRSTTKVKHIDIKYQFVNDLISKSYINLRYCPSEQMTADVFTKGLSSEKFISLRSMLGVKAVV